MKRLLIFILFIGIGFNLSATRRSCMDILAYGESTGDGTYSIDPDGVGGESPFDVYCDMTTDGGGWTLALKANGNQTTFGYASAYWTDDTLLRMFGYYGHYMNFKNAIVYYENKSYPKYVRCVRDR